MSVGWGGPMPRLFVVRAAACGAGLRRCLGTSLCGRPEIVLLIAYAIVICITARWASIRAAPDQAVRGAHRASGQTLGPAPHRVLHHDRLRQWRALGARNDPERPALGPGLRAQSGAEGRWIARSSPAMNRSCWHGRQRSDDTDWMTMCVVAKVSYDGKIQRNPPS
jgi:hypothetical protein